MKNLNKIRIKTQFLAVVLAVCFNIFPLFAERSPINVNLIIDGSTAYSNVSEEIAAWVCGRLDQILVDGDNLTIWNAESSAKVIYSNKISGSSDREAAKKIIRDLSASAKSDTADFSGALGEASRQRQVSNYSYTMLISASTDALSSVLQSPQANMLRYSRIEEYSAWRALVVGLNIDSKVKKAAAFYFGS
jgi:lipoate-protein ligase A